MNKNSIIGFALMGLVLIGFSIYNQPSEADLAAQRQQDSIAQVARDQAETARQVAEATRKAEALEAARNDTTALFYQALNGSSQQVVLQNEKVALTIDTKGGVVKKAVIKHFTDRKGNQDVTLFDKSEQELNFMLAGKTTNILTADLYFTPTNVSDSTVTLTAPASNGGALVLNYSLGKDYMLHFSLQAQGLSGIFAPNYQAMDIE